MTDKVTTAIERIKEGALMAERFTGKPMVVCYSGGKDSDVLLHLAIRAGVEMEAQNSHTSCDERNRKNSAGHLRIFGHICDVRGMLQDYRENLRVHQICSADLEQRIPQGRAWKVGIYWD